MRDNDKIDLTGQCRDAGVVAPTSCCSGKAPKKQKSDEPPKDPPVIRKTDSEPTFADGLGSWKARWGVGRMHYTVEPGLYSIGNPTPESNVFVSANYKMSFDRLRRHLKGRDGWIVVLDTKGINVWCAAGGGLFCTNEIVNRIATTRLAEVVTHRKLILPQLSAPGVSAHEVKDRTGFSVVYGPVRAEDLPVFLDSGMKATSEMRKVRFGFRDRLVLVPMEFVGFAKYLLITAAVFALLSGLAGDGGSSRGIAGSIVPSIVLLVSSYFSGTILTPLLLPWLPGRSFSSKGAWAGGIALIAVCEYHYLFGFLFLNRLTMLGWALLIPSVSSFLGMNFTGASTYTSISGVKKEMRIAVPIQIAGAAFGLGLWLAGRFM